MQTYKLKPLDSCTYYDIVNIFQYVVQWDYKNLDSFKAYYKWNRRPNLNRWFIKEKVVTSPMMKSLFPDVVK